MVLSNPAAIQAILPIHEEFILTKFQDNSAKTPIFGTVHFFMHHSLHNLMGGKKKCNELSFFKREIAIVPYMYYGYIPIQANLTPHPHPYFFWSSDKKVQLNLPKFKKVCLMLKSASNQFLPPAP